MRLLAFATLALVACCISAHAQSSGVPDVAEHEISRRGSHVEQTGTIRSGLMAAALSPPADDSAKWFITLVVRGGDRASATMQATIANDPAMKPWVNVAEPAKSMTHYQVRSINDATQANWLEALRPAIAQSGVPLVVLQPPKNGQFGSSSTVVKILAGVRTGDDLSKKLREAIIAYVDALEPRGISQTVIGAQPPPFVAPQQPAQPQVPFEWPQATPPATPPAPPATVTPPNPTTPAPSLPTTSLAQLLVSIGMFVAGWIGARMKTLAGGKLTEFNAILKAAQKNASAPPSPPSPSA